jgi:uncharacterized membrane protein YgcG
MARRLPQTLADYLVIAISPALIMALVGSLMFFLLRVFYQGQYGERLHWVMACFVFAAVLIARISIEEGFERAAPFGAALAILVGIAANRFMEYRGDWVDNFGWVINFGIIGLVWWCIHQLTWDCTVIDEDQDASGEGLMQVVGLERAADSNDESSASPATEEIEGTTSREVPTSFWQRYAKHERRPHTPGVWVVYFSLAALPIFGIGQWFIPVSDLAGRRHVFWLLGVYVASGLALLVTTSFLGLRRYLRQRRIEMPTTMANLWLATGGAIIAVLLVAAALLPRPSAEYAISQLPFTVGSPEQEASDAAPIERNGTKDDDSKASGQADPNADPSQEPTADGKGSKSGGDGSGEKSGGEGKSSDSKGGGAQDRSGKASAKGGEQKDGGESQSKGTNAEHADDQSQSQQNDQQKSGDGKQRETKSGKNPLENMKKFRELERELAAKYEDKPKDEETKAEQEQAKEAEASEADSPEIPPIEPPLGMLATILQYVFYGVVILGTIFAVWYYRREIIAGIRNFLNELAEWWRSLWGGKRIAAVAAEGPLDIRVPPPAFATFADPFASGTAGRMSPEELVRYSFSAFEAWSGEHGCPHEPDQTPHELVREVVRLNAHIAADARNLAELYARAAFARGQLPANTPAQLESLWQQMTRSLRVSV